LNIFLDEYSGATTNPKKLAMENKWVTNNGSDYHLKTSELPLTRRFKN
jgi:hypothetical protein